MEQLKKKQPQPLREGEVIPLDEKDRLDEREADIGPPPSRRPHRDDEPPDKAA
jgi:hypothetical protein